MREDVFRDHVIALAESTGWILYHVANVKGQLRSGTSIGFPDLVLVRRGRILFRELKTGKRKLTANQLHWLAELERCFPKGCVGVWRPTDWPEIVKELVDGSRS